MNSFCKSIWCYHIQKAWTLAFLTKVIKIVKEQSYNGALRHTKNNIISLCTFYIRVYTVYNSKGMNVSKVLSFYLHYKLLVYKEEEHAGYNQRP